MPLLIPFRIFYSPELPYRHAARIEPFLQFETESEGSERPKRPYGLFGLLFSWKSVELSAQEP